MMRIVLDILRRAHTDAAPYRQRIPFETEDAGATVAAALTAINAGGIPDEQGNPVEPVRWECSCLQKKCGACAMVIGGRPRLACDARLTEFAKKGSVTIEPLRKFPVIADLTVDRTVLFENLRRMTVWLTQDAPADEQTADAAYDASRCLQCGCCLEVCPNFCAEGEFAGAAAMIPAARLLTELPAAAQKPLREAYSRRFYAGCGKSLACRDVCPAGIETERLLVNSNAAAIWKRLLRRRKK
ncbi:MAG TPA: succinate dehydrogenase [Ruminococcus sp.]|nr:succinate dehydrogenase [Ruminococcus sp.]